MVRFEGWESDRGAAIIAEHASAEGAALPVLHAIQQTFGYVPPEAIPMVAQALNLSRAEMHGVVSFYHDFRSEPPGNHVLKLCRAEACQAMGADGLAAHARARLGIEWGGTTQDGTITVDPVFCLGLCACAPAAMVDGKAVARLDEARLDRLIDDMRGRA